VRAVTEGGRMDVAPHLANAPGTAGAAARALLDAAPDAMVCVNGRGRITLVNTLAESLLGYGRDELIGQGVEVLVPEQARGVHPFHRDAYLEDPRPRPMGAGIQLAARRRDGSEFPADISLSAFRTDDGTLVLAAIRDMTERIEAQAERERLRAQAERERYERQLNQSQRLESLGHLAGGVAHDFNNLLGAIVNYAALAERELAEAAASESGERWQRVRRDLEQIQLAAERGSRLTHQLLSFARREIARPQVVNLNDTVREVERLLHRTLGEHIEVDTSLAEDLRRTLIDPGHLEQVLVNLAVNARDAMPEGGVLRIRTDNVDLAEPLDPGQEAPVGRCVRLRVSDTGTGMTVDVATRVFEPFFTTKPEGDGWGLGLATAHGLLTQAGGTIRVKTAPNRGSTFDIFLPVTDEEPAAATPSAPDSALAHAGRGETVLVVEDEDDLREVITRLLILGGYDVITATDGEAALALARSPDTSIDLVLTDVVMPGKQGKEMAEAVVALRPGTPVVFMSGYARPVLGWRLEEGVALIEKPFSGPKLMAAVRTAIDSAQHRAGR
jgi:PAS domain S-box-containing protein